MLGCLTCPLTDITQKTAKLSTSLTGTLVKNLEITYWIGKQDKLVYKLETKLPTPIFDYTSTLRVYDHNSEFVSLKDR